LLNFRYHVVSLVAVFLALGIGVIMGSAVIDRATINVLEDQEDRLRAEIEDARNRISELEGELGAIQDQQQRLADEGSEVLLDGRLEGVPVVVVAPEDVGGETFDALTELLAGADAQLLGLVRLRDRVALDDDGARRELAQLLGRPEFTSADTLRRVIMEVVATALAGTTIGTGGTAASQEQGGEEPASVMRGLAEAGFLDLQPGDGAVEGLLERPPVGSQVIVLWGPGDSDAIARGLLLARALAALPIPMVVAEETVPVEDDPEESQPLSLVQAIRGDTALATQASTVDNLEQFVGRVAAVLALDAQGRGEVGHFGIGEGSQSLLPPAAEPVTGG